MAPSRRSFLVSSLAAATSLATTRRVLGANERVGVAVIGVNGMGHTHVKTLAASQGVDLVALCDIDPAVLNRAVRTVTDAGKAAPALVPDFRTVLDDKTVEAVVIATPHHWHAPIALRALAAGRDIYIEKPAAHVFREGRFLVEAAARHQRIVQHGTQMRFSEVIRADMSRMRRILYQSRLSSPDTRRD